jgi:hypothetical protein
LACVEFHKHDWLLAGFGHLIRGDGRNLISNSALPGPRSRPCHCGVRHGDRRLAHRVAARRSHWSAPSTHAGG